MDGNVAVFDECKGNNTTLFCFAGIVFKNDSSSIGVNYTGNLWKILVSIGHGNNGVCVNCHMIASFDWLHNSINIGEKQPI